MGSGHRFEVAFLEEAASFLDEIDGKAKRKILYNIRRSQVKNDKELFKKLTANIWEFRTLNNRTYYRLFAFWDRTGGGNTLVVATHGLIKKTGKTPKQEIERAERLRKQYMNMKTGKNER